MAIMEACDVEWRRQECEVGGWLTCIEMLMHAKYGNIHGPGRTAHAGFAMEERMKNQGSPIALHADDYGLVANGTLALQEGPACWEVALGHGPVLATGTFGAATSGAREHAILIFNISATGELAYVDPTLSSSIAGKSRRSWTMSLRQCRQLAAFTGFGPFWQVREDVEASKHEVWRAYSAYCRGE